MLKQAQYKPMETSDQIILLLANKLGLIDEIDINRIKEYETELLFEVNNFHEDLVEELNEKKVIDDKLNERLTDVITIFTTQFRLMD